MGVLSQLVFVPLLGMIIVMCLPKDNAKLIRWTAALISVIPFLQSLWLLINYFSNYSGSAVMAYQEGPSRTVFEGLIGTHLILNDSAVSVVTIRCDQNLRTAIVGPIP